jgi:hypothetical protein
LSRPGARCRGCSRSVSPGRSPNPPCRFPRYAEFGIAGKAPAGFGGRLRGKGRSSHNVNPDLAAKPLPVHESVETTQIYQSTPTSPSRRKPSPESPLRPHHPVATGPTTPYSPSSKTSEYAEPRTRHTHNDQHEPPQARHNPGPGIFSATGSPQCLSLGVVDRGPGVGDLHAAIPVSGDRHLGEVEQLDPVRRRPRPAPSGPSGSRRRKQRLAVGADQTVRLAKWR